MKIFQLLLCIFLIHSSCKQRTETPVEKIINSTKISSKIDYADSVFVANEMMKDSL